MNPIDELEKGFLEHFGTDDMSIIANEIGYDPSIAPLVENNPEIFVSGDPDAIDDIARLVASEGGDDYDEFEDS